MRKKSEKNADEVLHPEIERHLPVKPVAMPSLDELNKLMARMLQEERRRARRESALIVTGLSLIFVLILAGAAWFTHDVMQQLKQERRLSEKSREDLLGLIYSGHLTAGTAPAPAPAHIADGAVSAAPENASALLPAVAATNITANTPNEAPAAPAAFRSGLEARVSEDMVLRLPIPPPQ